jgi:hypothetical protein
MDFSLLLGLRLPGQFLHIEGQALQRIDTRTPVHVVLFQFSWFVVGDLAVRRKPPDGVNGCLTAFSRL